jgi:hypothetical protein
VSILDQPAPAWDTMPAEAQAEHYAAALAEARERGAAEGAAQQDLEAALRRHTPPAITMRHDGRRLR